MSSWSHTVLVAGAGVTYDGATLALLPTYDGYLSNANGPNGVPVADSGGVIGGRFVPAHGDIADYDAVVPLQGELVSFDDTQQLRLGDGVADGGVDFALNSKAAVCVAAQRTETKTALALLNAYTRAAALTPNGSALSTTNRAKVILMGIGRASLGGAGSNLTLASQFVDIVGLGGPDHNVILTDGTYYAEQSVDDTWLDGLTLRGVATASPALLKISASANTNLRHTNVVFWPASNADWATEIGNVATFGGTYKNIVCVQGSQFYSGISFAGTCSAVFENVAAGVNGETLRGNLGGGFGGALNTFSGSMYNVRNTIGAIGIIVTGLIYNSRLRSSRTSTPAVVGGASGKIMGTTLISSAATIAPVGKNGAAARVTMSIAGCRMRFTTGGTGIDDGDGSTTGVANNIDTPNNVVDADLPATA